MSRTAYFTICSNNYMSYALTLGRSLRAVQPDAQFTIVLADEWDPAAAPEAVEFPIIESSKLGLPTFEDMTTRYTVLEFNTAIKPRAIQYLMEVEGADHAIYLDPDIYVVSPLKELEASLSAGANAILTPHALAPLDDGGDPDDVRLMRTGAYNLGFAAFSRSEETLEFLRWWERRLETDCRVALSEGIFVDQKFMDLAPCYLDKVQILRHAGYNVAYWNLMHRPVVRKDGVWHAGAEPLRFFHFSGVIPGNHAVFSKHQNRFDVHAIGVLRKLLDEYLRNLQENGHTEWSKIPYAYDNLDGQKLDQFMRRIYARKVPSPQQNVSMTAAEIMQLANQFAQRDSAARPISEYALEIWRSREDLRAAFDLQSEEGFDAYSSWLLTSGVKEHNIPEQRMAWIDRSSIGPTQIENHRTSRGRRAKSGRLGRTLSQYIIDRLDFFRPIYKAMPQGLVSRLRKIVVSNAIEKDLPAGLGVQPLPGRTVPGVAVYGYFNTESGVGEGARQAFNALSHTSMPVEAFLLPASETFRNSVDFPPARPVQPSLASIRIFHVNADQSPNVMKAIGAEAERPDIYRIGYWAWELERFPEAWREASKNLDEIWAPSQFTRDSIAAAVSCPVICVPHAVELPGLPSIEVRETVRARHNIPKEATAFLNSFDFNSYIARKNPWATLEAFQRLRRERDDVAMVFKTHGTSNDKQSRKAFLEAAAATPGVIVVDGVLSRTDQTLLQAACDALISLHRSEGFGLNILEMMALGKPVIATNYSGNCDFLDETVGYPIEYKLTPVGAGDYPYSEDQVWAEPSISDAVAAMRQIAEAPSISMTIGNAARRRVRMKYSSESIGKLIESALKRPAAS